MGKYLHKFNTIEQLNQEKLNNYIRPWVGYVSVQGQRIMSWNIPETVDLGLPSGNLWASFNFGATNYLDNGTYYEWGELTPSDGDNSTYRWGNPPTKYNATDNKRIIDLEDDIIHLTLGSTWKIPSVNDVIELQNNTTFTRDTTNGLAIYTSKNNGNKLYFPISFLIWTSDIYPSDVTCAYYLGWDKDSGYTTYNTIDKCIRRVKLNLRGIKVPSL